MSTRRLFDGAQSELGSLPIVAASSMVTATGAITLDAVAVAGVGTSTIQASGAVTLDAVAIAGSATIGAATITATGAITLGAVVVAGVGRQTHIASGAVSLGAVVVAGVGRQTHNASGAIALSAAAVAGVASPVVVASGAVSLGAITVAGAGTSTVQASGSIALGSVSVAGVGTSTVTSSGAIALGSVSIAGAASPVAQAAGAIALDSVTIAGTGAVLAFVLPGPLVGQLACVAPSVVGLVLTVPGSSEFACVAPSVEDLVCTVGASASLACVVRNAWAFPAVSFTRSPPLAVDVTFREAGTPYANLGATTVDVPWCGVVGDLILLAVTVRGAGTFTTPAGWSLVALVEISFCRTAVFSRVKAPSDVGNVAVTVNATSTQTTIGQMFAFSGASTVTAGAPFTSTTSNETIGPVPGVTAAKGEVVVAIGARSNEWVTITALSGDGLTWQQAAAVSTTIGGDAGQVVDLAACSGAVTVTDKTWSTPGVTATAKTGIMLVVSP